MTDDEKDAGEEVFEFRGRSRTTAPRSPEVDEPVDTGTRDEDAADDPPESSHRPRVGLLAWSLLVVSLVAVVVAFLSWRGAHDDPDRDRAALRDSAVIEGTAAVETMTSMDYRDVESGIKAWQDASTGVLHDQFLSVGDDELQMLADQGKIASGRVVQAALTQLTDRTATLIVAVEVTVRDGADDTQDPAVKRNRFSADLVLVGGEWKIENLPQVAVNL